MNKKHWTRGLNAVITEDDFRRECKEYEAENLLKAWGLRGEAAEKLLRDRGFSEREAERLLKALGLCDDERSSQ